MKYETFQEFKDTLNSSIIVTGVKNVTVAVFRQIEPDLIDTEIDILSPNSNRFLDDAIRMNISCSLAWVLYKLMTKLDELKQL